MGISGLITSTFSEQAVDDFAIYVFSADPNRAVGSPPALLGKPRA